ncbi:hypothetical protein FB451DRAFT_1169897 [Mycena latifolia]|nr:hypothetical protein FB451DRAFT_1169897 [Mycena latifolia]
MILETGKTLSVPRAAESTMDRMLENAFYAAQVLGGASAGSMSVPQHQSRAHAAARASPVMVQQTPPAPQHQQPQPQRLHSASTASSSSTSDTTRPPGHTQPAPLRSPPRMSASVSARVKDPPTRDVKAKIKSKSPVNGRAAGGSHGYGRGGSDATPAGMSSPSKPQSQKMEDSGHAPAGPDVGAGGQDAHHIGSGGPQKCLGCGATATPEWRRGPLGEDTCASFYAGDVLTLLGQVKKRMREDVRASGGGGRAATSSHGRTGQHPRGESPEAESDEDDEAQSYDHAQMPGR